MASAKDLAKRALVTLIRFLAGVYSSAVVVKRDATEEDVRKAYRSLSRFVHPDGGGRVADHQQLNAAYEKGCRIIELHKSVHTRLLKNQCEVRFFWKRNGPGDMCRATIKEFCLAPAKLKQL